MQERTAAEQLVLEIRQPRAGGLLPLVILASDGERYSISGRHDDGCRPQFDVEVDRASGKVRVAQVWAATDAGLVINPDGLKNQIEGGIIQSASWTLFATSGFLGVLLCLLLIEGSLFHTHVGFHMLKAASSWPDRFLVPPPGRHSDA